VLRSTGAGLARLCRPEAYTTVVRRTTEQAYSTEAGSKGSDPAV